MSDIRPARPAGVLRPTLSTKKVSVVSGRLVQAEVVQLGKVFPSETVPLFHKVHDQGVLEPVFPEREEALFQESAVVSQEPVARLGRGLRKSSRQNRRSRSRFFASVRRKTASAWFVLASATAFLFGRRTAMAGVTVALVGVLGFSGFALFHKGMRMKGEVLGVSQEGYTHLTNALEEIRGRRFDRSGAAFQQAYESFSIASNLFGEWNAVLVDLSRFVPGISKLSSGKNVVEAGKHIAVAGQELNSVLQELSAFGYPLQDGGIYALSLLEVFQKTQGNIARASRELALAEEALRKVRLEDVPEDKRDRFIQVRQQLPEVVAAIQAFSDHSHIFTDLLGGNGPRKYLFLFQNNHEMRPTGGFIGSYGLLDVSNGRIRNFFVDGIFNPDGQLKEDIVPPRPIQKVSAAWSLHDSNWFPDFPTSAEKAIFFYEKTGGPTVDGVITLTPVVIQKFLRITGPIEMEKYGVTVDADNFMETIQYEVEVDYDKEENRPKQILADLAPLLLDKLMSASDVKDVAGMMNIFEEGLDEKHVLLYSRNREVQELIDAQGWSGKVLEASKDYLSVINTNINGYKTDGVIEESIEHEVNIREDGSIVDTVTVTRKHTGGYTDYVWWNKVNADYMRVYVPKGSKLLSAEGYTRETVEPPVDYDRLGFRRDAEVEAQERGIVIDPESGTQIYEEAGKTVFGNWVYVSPQETVTVTYTYLLPFTVQPEADSEDEASRYTVTYQKQSGSVGSQLDSRIVLVPRLQSGWQASQNLVPYEGGLRLEDDLKTDVFAEVMFGRPKE
jgi:hypothetical protein